MTGTKRGQEIAAFSYGDDQQPTRARTEASSATAVKAKPDATSTAKAQKDAAAGTAPKVKTAPKVASKAKAKIAADNPTEQGESACEQVNASSIYHS